MSGAIFQSTTIPFLEQAVNFAQARHNVLAGNLANIDTPGYHARDLSPELFQARLKQAITTREEAPAGDGGSPSASLDNAMNDVHDAASSILYHDGSNDSVEQQVAEITKNQMQHNLALTILTSQFRLLQAAISERA